MALALYRINWREVALLVMIQTEGELTEVEMEEDAMTRTAKTMILSPCPIIQPAYATPQQVHPSPLGIEAHEKRRQSYDL